MKTPEEIKKGLYICYVQPDGRTCGICPYDVINEGYCECNLVADALEYIHQLEHQIGELTEKVAQLEKERNALLDDLREADMTMCNHCAYFVTTGSQGKCDGYCWDCDGKDCPCNTCWDNSNWKWRGVQEGE